jgi:phosphohistidine phosphatase
MEALYKRARYMEEALDLSEEVQRREPMRLYLVRHGVSIGRAEFSGPDEDRPLTEKGRKDLSKLFQTMRRHEEPPGEIWTSPLVRAVQTAETLACYWAKNVPVKISRALMADVPPAVLLDEISKANPVTPLALVGHEPQLGLLLAHLTEGQESLSLPKGSVCRVRFRADDTPRGRFVCCHIPNVEKVIVELDELCSQ